MSTRQMACELERFAANKGSAARQRPTLARLQSAYIHPSSRLVIDRMKAASEQALSQIERLSKQEALLHDRLHQAHQVQLLPHLAPPLKLHFVIMIVISSFPCVAISLPFVVLR